MSRSKFLILIVAVLLLGTVSSVFAQGTTLVVWADATRAPVILSLADQVEADLGITLEVVEMGFGDIRDQLLVAGPVGEGPDVLIGAHDWLGQLVVNGAVVPIELGDLEAEFSPVALEAFTYDGQLYGVPYGVENVALIRNVDLVPEAPTTWQEVLTISQDLQASGEAQYGFLVRSGDFYHVYPIITAFGGYVFGTTENGSYNPGDVGLSGEGGLAAAEWFGEMYSAGLTPTNVGDDESFALFEDGQAAMFITGPWWIDRIKETGINYSIDPLPGAEGGLEEGRPFLGVQGFMISAFSQNQLLAEIFLTEYVASTEFMQSMFDGDPRGPAWLAVDTSGNPDVGAFGSAGTNGYSMPAIPEMSAVWSAAGNAITLIGQGEPAVATFENAQTQIIERIGQLTAGTSKVTIAGDLQDEVGCAADWDPACDASSLVGQGDGIWTATFTVPAGEYQYKATINGDWAENYGLDSSLNGDNIPLLLAEDTEVTFTFNDNEKTITDSVNN